MAEKDTMSKSDKQKAFETLMTSAAGAIVEELETLTDQDIDVIKISVPVPPLARGLIGHPELKSQRVRGWRDQNTGLGQDSKNKDNDPTAADDKHWYTWDDSDPTEADAKGD